jgi:hypothetical protein
MSKITFEPAGLPLNPSFMDGVDVRAYIQKLMFELEYRQKHPEPQRDPIKLDEEAARSRDLAVLNLLQDTLGQIGCVMFMLVEAEKVDPSVVHTVLKALAGAFHAGLSIKQADLEPIISEFAERPQKTGSKGGKHPKGNPVMVQAVKDAIALLPAAGYPDVLRRLKSNARSNIWTVGRHTIIFERGEFKFEPVAGSRAKALRPLKAASIRRYYDEIKKGDL